MSPAFEIQLDCVDTYYYAVSHRPVIRSFALTNLDVDPSAGDIVVQIHVDGATHEPLLHSKTFEIPALQPRDTKQFRAVRIEPNHRELALLYEEMTADLTVTATVQEQVVGVARQPITFLAYNQWMHRPEFFDSFASFVMPNHPAISPIMQRARELLGARTGDTSTAGYQTGDPQRVRSVAKAIFDSLAAEGLAYSSAPASFEGHGQKIRTPDVVFLERCATCLDTSVLFASCLAAAGIEPVLVLSTGHAFAGYWSDPIRADPANRELMSRPVIDNRNDIAGLFAAGLLDTVETTFVTASNTVRSFEAALSTNRAMFGGDVMSLDAVVNVAAARAAGVRPIPSRRIVEGVVELDHSDGDQRKNAAFTGSGSWPAAETPRRALPPPGVPTPDDGSVANSSQRLEAFEAPPRVRAWLSSLLDLSFANPLIDLRPGRSAFRFELPPGMLAAVENRLLSSDRGLELVPASKVPARVLDEADLAAALINDFGRSGRLYSPAVELLEPTIEAARRTALTGDPTMPPAVARRSAEESVAASMAQALQSSISLLQRKAREIESQSGSNNLFLTIGALKWTEPPSPGQRKRDGPATAPLFLIPVRITGSATSAYWVKADEGVEVTPNYCLLEKLRQTFDLVIPELETPDLDVSGIDVDKTLAAIRRALGERSLSNLVVEETAHLAVLNFATFRLWKDMRDHWQHFMGNDVVRHLVERPYEAFEQPVSGGTGPDVSEDLLCPIEIDESQLDAVRWAVQGRSFVIEGPPGTGKSQTITNLLAASIAANKRVLFVAEKQPALQVVKKRLEQIGLTPFCIDLHDKGSKPEQIRKQVRDAIDFAGVDRETEWNELSARLLADEQALAAYRDVIHGPNLAGYSAWSARQELVDLGGGESAEVPESVLGDPGGKITAVRDALLALPATASGTRLTPGGPWALSNLIDFSAVDQQALSSTIAGLQHCLDEFAVQPPQLKHVLARLDGPDSFADVIRTVDLALTTALTNEATLAGIGTATWLQERGAAFTRSDALAGSLTQLAEIFDPRVFGTDLGPVRAAAAEAATAGLLSRGRRKRELNLLLTPLLRAAASGEPPEYVALLQQVQAAKDEAVGVATQLRALPGLTLSTRWTAADPADLATARNQAMSLPEQAAVLRSPTGALTRAALAAGWVPTTAAMTALRTAHDLWSRFGFDVQVTPRSMQRWRNGRGFLEAWAGSNPTWHRSAPRLLDLQRWSDVVACLRPLEDAGLTHFLDRILAGGVDVADSYDQFRRGLVGVALRERLDAGRVDQFDGLAHDRRVQNFIARAAQKRQLMRSVIPQHLVHERPFRPGARFGEYGALERELSKTTRRLSIRKLVERYGEILPNMTPCFLMSPDSVARFLPPGAITFDLVVFDEASQIEVAEAIGAMGRAKAVVIVGDSKQMPPSNFGGPGLGDATEAEVDGDAIDDAQFQDLESILSECVESNLPRLWLQCHYRSRHEGLIAFSNAAFYDGKLTTFPSPLADGPAPIHWRRIDGHFDRTGTGDDKRTNRLEAEAIVADIVRRLDDPVSSRQSICVVTLNIQQQALVHRLLDETGDERIRSLLEDDTDAGLIVRNLESVQGDERDVVIISIAFAPVQRETVDGVVSRRLPLNFGPLNRKGGERRLNVAVTRARSEVCVFCSFDPEEMRLAENPAKGLQLLKQYLAIARDGASMSGDLLTREVTVADHHRSAIAAALRTRGLRVKENVGLSKFRVDLTVGHPDRGDWQVAVLLDGPDWAARSTVYDRDALPVGVLASMGWKRVVRIWLPSWIQEPRRILDEIANAVASALVSIPPPPPPVASVAAAAIAPPPGALAPSPSAQPLIREMAQMPTVAARPAPLELAFVAARTSPAGDRNLLDRLEDPDAAAAVGSAVDEALAVEAPVHATRLAKIVATKFGLERLTAARAQAILALATRSQSRVDEFGTFLWSLDTVIDDWRNYRRTPDGVERKLEHIAPEEIGNAILHIVEMSHSIELLELHRVVGEIFGFEKLTASVRKHLQRVVIRLVDESKLIEADGRVRLR